MRLLRKLLFSCGADINRSQRDKCTTPKAKSQGLFDKMFKLCVEMELGKNCIRVRVEGGGMRGEKRGGVTSTKSN